MDNFLFKIYCGARTFNRLTFSRHFSPVGKTFDDDRQHPLLNLVLDIFWGACSLIHLNKKLAAAERGEKTANVVATVTLNSVGS